MKDFNNETLHIGEKVTIHSTGRPRLLIGRYGVVEQLGDVRIKIKLDPIAGGEQKTIRIEPSKVIRGHVDGIGPFFDKGLELKMKGLLDQGIIDFLERSVTRKIITERQKDALLKYFILGAWDNDADT